MSNNLLDRLPELPGRLEEIHVRNNRLPSLPELPDRLREFFLSNNLLTTLPVLPASLQTLSVENNRLTALPDLPSGLMELYANGNWLVNLPVVPPGRENCVVAVRRWQQHNPDRGAGDVLDFNPAYTTRDNDSWSSWAFRAAASGVSTVFSAAYNAAAGVAHAASCFRSAPDLFETDLPPPAQAASSDAPAWQPGRVPTAGSWEFSDPNSTDFNAFQLRIRETAEYSNRASQPRLIARMNALVAAMRAAPQFRDICFGIASQAIESCSDRIAQGVIDMERARINHDVEVKNYPLDKLLRNH